jgi:hypothetical protein
MTTTQADQKDSKVVSEIREMFDRYGPTFVELTDGSRSDMDALLNFYSAPLRFIGPTFHMVMKNNGDITGPDGVGGEIARLHKAHLSGSTLDKFEVRVLNPRAALVDTIWMRRDSDGKLIARYGVTYLVALTADGWRITSAVNTSE